MWGAKEWARACGARQLEDYRLLVLSDFGRPTLRSFTASRSFGSISHSRPSFIAFKRLASISARTLFGVTPNLRAASAVLMMFMRRSISTMAQREQFV